MSVWTSRLKYFKYWMFFYEILWRHSCTRGWIILTLMILWLLIYIHFCLIDRHKHFCTFVAPQSVLITLGTFLRPAAGWHFWFRLRCFDRYLMDCRDICSRHSCLYRCWCCRVCQSGRLIKGDSSCRVIFRSAVALKWLDSFINIRT